MSVSFDLSFHGMCTEHQAILQSSSGYDFLDLDQVGLEQMPDVFVLSRPNINLGLKNDTNKIATSPCINMRLKPSSCA